MILGINAVRLTRPFTGVGRYVECLLREWAASGTPFDEIILYAPGEIRSDLVNFPLSKYAVRILRMSAPDPIWEWRRLRTVNREVDILFGPSYTLPLGYEGPSAVSYHGPSHFPRWSPAAARGAIYDRLYRHSAGRADHVFVPSKAVKNRVTGVYGIPAEKVGVTYMAASELFEPADDPDQINAVRRNYVGGDEPYFLFVGKLSGRHFIPELLEAYRDAVNRTGMPHRLVLAGPDTLGYNVPERARQLGMAERIRWTSFVPHQQLPALYSAAEGFVFPACEAEGFGIPVLEAMACGTPVISVDQGSISEFARGSALLVEQPSSPLLSDAFQKLSEDRGLRRTLSAAGIETARRITWKYTAEKTLRKLWEIALRRKAREPRKTAD